MSKTSMLDTPLPFDKLAEAVKGSRSDYQGNRVKRLVTKG